MNRRSFVSSICATASAAIAGLFVSRFSASPAIEEKTPLLPNPSKPQGEPYTLWTANLTTLGTDTSEDAKRQLEGIRVLRVPLTGSSEEIVAKALIDIAYLCALAEERLWLNSRGNVAQRMEDLIRSASENAKNATSIAS